MINSIEIKNFKNLSELTLNSIEQINLISGKNNTGKSSLLEAIGLQVSQGSLSFLEQILTFRGENYRSRPTEDRNIIQDNYFKSFSTLFTNRVVGFEKKDSLSIKTNITSRTKDLFNGINQNNLLLIRIAKYFDVMSEDSETLGRFRERIIAENKSDIDKLPNDLRIGLIIDLNNKSNLIPFNGGLRIQNIGDINAFQLIRANDLYRELNGKLWDSIALTVKEQYIIDALKIIEPNVERITFVAENTITRSPVMKLKNYDIIQPLRSMGDGINRILTIILAMVNVENGYLLIDEFENGLHYTTQEKLWEIIFYLAEKLNVQVFATTHSRDCIEGFENVLNDTQNKITGKMILLSNRKGKISPVEFDKDELKIATEQDIEVR